MALISGPALTRGPPPPTTHTGRPLLEKGESGWVEGSPEPPSALCSPRSVFYRGVQEIKKVENVSRSPWFSHITSSMQGLGIIHAYDRREDCITK